MIVMDLKTLLSVGFLTVWVVCVHEASGHTVKYHSTYRVPPPRYPDRFPEVAAAAQYVQYASTYGGKYRGTQGYIFQILRHCMFVYSCNRRELEFHNFHGIYKRTLSGSPYGNDRYQSSLDTTTRFLTLMALKVPFLTIVSLLLLMPTTLPYGRRRRSLQAEGPDLEKSLQRLHNSVNRWKGAHVDNAHVKQYPKNAKRV